MLLALATSSAAAGLDPDLPPLLTALGAEFGGGVASVEDWHDDTVDWGRFDAVILRSTWDYVDHLDAFLAWVGNVESETRLVNPAGVVRWNVDKRYLGELAENGIPIVPTAYVEEGEDPPATTATAVVKPTVGAGSSGARRCRPDEVAAHVEVLHHRGRTAMVQPYMDAIDHRGETSLCYLLGADGSLEFSHAVRKGPILHAGEPAWDGGLVAREEISAREPSADELALGRSVLGLDCVRRHGVLTYARIDLVPGVDGPAVMELELVEPSMHFDTAGGSAVRAARAFAYRLP